MDVEVRRLQQGEELAFIRSERIPFLEPFSGEQSEIDNDERAAERLEVDRAWVAVADGRFVGQCDIKTMDLSIPPAPGKPAPVIPMAGVSGVGVHPTHRRRGILTQMMGHMLDDSRQRGEVIAGLLASESVIYGRFGYGCASSITEWDLDSHDSAFLTRAPEADIRILDKEEAAAVLPALHERTRLARPGEANIRPAIWTEIFRDPSDSRGGGSARMYAACDGGYAIYQAKGDLETDPLRGGRVEVVVNEMHAATPEAEAALWRFIFDLDLVGRVHARKRPVDESLRWRLADPRRIQWRGVYDRLWIRIVDVAKALEARGYRRNGRIVLDLVDGDGRWVLEAGPDGAECRASKGEPDLRMGIRELGAIYLGGHHASELAAAGRIDELTAGSLDVADSLFGTPLAPLSLTGF